jgi:hypothetical protein
LPLTFLKSSVALLPSFSALQELALMDDDESAPDHKSCRSPLSAYDGCLLRLALDLGRRLLPAFLNPVTQREGRGQGLPYAWVNLRTGLTENEVTETCTWSQARGLKFGCIAAEL